MADDLEKEVLRAQRDVAQDVAAQAARERDMAAMQRNTAAAQRDVLHAQRDGALQYAAVEEEAARGSAVGFWVLLGVVAIALLIWAAVSLNRSQVPASPTVVNRTTPSVPPMALTPPVELPRNNAPAETVTPVAPPPDAATAPAAPSAPSAPAQPAYTTPAPPSNTTSAAPTGATGTDASGAPTTGSVTTNSTDASGSTTTTPTTTPAPGSGQ